MSYHLLARDERKARKPHQCIYCYEGIGAGERYFYERCFFNGEPQSNHWHPECWDDFQIVVTQEGGYAEFNHGENERPKRASAPQSEGRSP